ncbi:MAG: DUF4384 domain-containing protein [Pirellulales bacterium]
MVGKQGAWKMATGVMILAFASWGYGQEQVVPRGLFVEEVQNPHQAFLVRVSVDHENRIYREGETLTATVRSSADGYLYLFNRDSQGTVRCLFPNKYQTDNEIKANKDTLVPPPDAPAFRIRIGAPFGEEVLKAIVTKERLPFDNEGLRKAAATEVDYQGIKAAFVEGADRKPAKWAEHSVNFTTIAKDGTPAVRGPRRVGLFIGLAKYRDQAIRPLPACRPDAETMFKTMKMYGGLDEAHLLLDEQATLAKIVEHIQGKLAQGTRPGDTVFIYWSGHGGRCADDNGDETDGLDEFLVTYDAQTNNPETLRNSVLLDDHFGRLMQHLDGRKVVLLLDTCHSGGQATAEKGLRGLDGVKSLGDLDMLDGELQHTKDIGQKETALLVSSRAAQISFVRKEGDLSVMTKFLDQLIRESQGPLSLTEAAAQLKKLVPEYVADRFPGATQTPELIDNTSPPLYLRK